MKYQVLYPEGKKKAFTLSYDDGQIFDRRLVELFNHYGVKASFHLNSGTLGTNNVDSVFITKEEVKSLYEGHEISAHGVNHPYFLQLPRDQQVFQVLEDKRNLERLCGYPVRGMSYPFGEYSDEFIEIARALGIEYARTVEATYSCGIPRDFMKWHPSCHHDEVDRVMDEFLNPPHYRDLMLFYVWGHSFEFDRANTWEKMEEFLKVISGRADVWYATNIEIKDYIDAYRNLKVTADETVIYNPSAIPVWIGFEGKILIAEPGKCLEL